MIRIRNALLYIKNRGDDSADSINRYLRAQPGVSRVSASTRSKHLIFIDYQPHTRSMPEILYDMARQGMSARIVGM